MATYNCIKWSWVYVKTTTVFRTMVTLSVHRHFKARCVEVQEAWLQGRLLNPVTKSISPAKVELSGFYPDQLVIRSKMSSNYNDSLLGNFYFYFFQWQDKRDGQRWACHVSGHPYDLKFDRWLPGQSQSKVAIAATLSLPHPQPLQWAR